MTLDQPARRGFADTQVRRPIWRKLAAIGFGTVFFACAAIGSIAWYSQNVMNKQAINADLDQSARAIQRDFESQGRIAMGVALDLANEPDTTALVAAGNRAELLRRYQSIVAPLTETLDVHLATFTSLAGGKAVALLRLHDPSAFGDDITKRRKLIAAAFRDGKAFMGLEMGRSKLCAFATLPLKIDGKVIGVIDIGTEIADAYFARLKAVFGVDIGLRIQRNGDLEPQNATFAEKTYLDTEEAKAAFGGEVQRKLITRDGRTTAITAVPLKDFSGDAMGVLEIGHDVTAIIAAQHANLWTLIGGGALVAVLSLIVFVAFALSLARPIRDLTHGMNRLASGDLDPAISGRGRHDEIGAMAAAVQVFKTNALALDQANRAHARLADESEVTRRQTEVERAGLAREQQGVVQAIASGLARLSEGDLTHRIDVAFAPAYQKLKDDFNHAADRLAATMKSVAGTTRDILSGADDIARAADDLSRRTEQQAAALEETAASMTEITKTVNATAANARVGASVVSSAKEGAEQSAGVVGEAARAMTAIEGSSSRIGNIIGVINEIAFQTNLLALNAGVEAARAGEAGRGFAVVASEVRALAQRSADAAKEIRTLISASSSQVELGVGLVGRTSEALHAIAARVVEMNALMGTIAASADEQATGLRQVNTAIAQMDQATQQNAAMVEESTAALHTLATRAADLDRIVGSFKL
jgi:methyl-accepting chemotaxis protein